MENGQRPATPVNAEMLQQALRAFGTGNVPTNSVELAAMAQRMGIPLPSATDAPRADPPVGTQYVFIALDSLDIAWPASKVAGVERVNEITSVPNTVPWVLGVANLRGAITSVVDLRRFFGLPPTATTPRSRIVVASAAGMIIGFLVDGVNEIRAVPPEAQFTEGVRGTLPAWLVPYVDAATTVNGRRILIMDIERFLFADSLHHYRAD